MKKLAAICCFLALAGGVAVATDAGDNITKLSAKQMSRDPGALPKHGFATAGQPDEAMFKNFADAGYSTVIDMRAADEDRGLDEPRTIEALGMTYVAFPIASANDISFEKAAELDEILRGADGPILVHCASGNRVGALFALRARNNGADSEDALAIGKAAGLTRLEEVVLERLDLK